MKIRMQKIISIAAFCAFILCASANNVQADLSPFAGSGLLTRPDESAEEILLRAHQLDAGAIILTAAGYAQGISGFPKNAFLAFEWNQQLAFVDSLASTGLLTLMIFEQQKYPLDTFFSHLLVACSFARNDAIALFFKEKGLFDAQFVCKNLERKKKSMTDWKKEYDGIMASTPIFMEDLRKYVKAVRAFRDEPCSQQVQKNLETAQTVVLPETLLFYAATTHDLAKGVPDWNAERLLSFIDKLETCKGYENKDSVFGNIPSAQRLAMLSDMAANTLKALISQDREKALALIRSAHSRTDGPDYVDAARAMSAQYRTGGLGFFRSDILSKLWLQHAAFTFDNPSRLLLAMDWFFDKRYPEAWAWADAIGKDKDADRQTKKLAAMLVERIEKRAGAKVRQDGGTLQTLYLQGAEDLIDWLKLQDKQGQ